MQKRGYLLLEKLTSCCSPSLEQFLQDNVSNIQQLLIEATANVKTASKKVCLVCPFIHVYDNLQLVEDEMYSSFCETCDPSKC